MELSDKATEENVLALIMNAKKDVVSDVFARITPEDFYFDGYRKVFTFLYGCYMAGEETTLFSMAQKHRADFEQLSKMCPTSLIEIGSGFKDIDYANQMLDKSEDTIGILSDRLAEKRHMRDLNEIQNRIADGLEKEEATEKTYEAIESLLLSKHTSSANRSYLSPTGMADLMLSAVAERMDKTRREKEIIYTSYEQFNRRSGGLEKGNLVILSAASGVGKSAMAINIVRDVAYVGGKPVLYLNSEMTDKQQARRYASLLSKVSHKAIRNGDVTEAQYNKILQVAADFSGKQIHTITIPDMQLTHVVAEIKRMKVRCGIELAVVDYVGRMDVTKAFGRDMQEWQIMEQTARELKNLALELDIVIIMVAQMSSNGQSLAKGSSMKNECDLWINLKRVDKDDLKEYYDTHGEGLDKWWNVILDFKKARSAEFGAKIPMHFYGDELLFTDNEEEAKHFMYLEQEPSVEEDNK
jgi:replicative DNA helicase